MARRSFINRAVGTLIGLPVSAVVVLFAVSNRQTIEVGFWPFPVELAVPAWALGLGTMLFGFVIGAMVAWFAAGATRRRAHVAEVQARRLERRLEETARQVEDMQKSLPAPAAHSH